MQQYLRICFDMAVKARAFCLAYPDPDPASILVVARLTQSIERAETLSLQQRASQTVVAAAVSQKTQYRTIIENGLAALFGFAKAAAVVHPSLAVHRRVPRPRASENTLLTTARVAVTEATATKELLIPYGLPAGLLDDLTAAIDGFEAEIARQGTALAAQVGASADLRAVTGEIMKIVKNLDAIHRVRFSKDRELMAAWKSARNAHWRSPEPVVPVTPPTTGGDTARAA